MKIDIDAYNEHYHQAGKFIDKFQEGIKLIPFDSRNASAYDKKCGLQGTTGEFFRLWLNDGSKAIDDFIDSASLMQYYGYQLYSVEGPFENIKITTPIDFYIFRAIVDAKENSQIFGL